MRQKWTIQVILVICIIIVLILLRRSKGTSAGLAQAPGPAAAPVVTDSAEALLDRYEELLEQGAPTVLAAMQPGLTDAEITALESKCSTKLTPDLRALYRWHNGIPRTTTLNAFPDHRFPPLDEVFAERASLQTNLKKQSTVQRLAFAAFAGQRTNWLAIFPDGSGDGYFYDPNHGAGQGSFLAGLHPLFFVPHVSRRDSEGFGDRRLPLGRQRRQHRRLRRHDVTATPIRRARRKIEYGAFAAASVLGAIDNSDDRYGKSDGGRSGGRSPKASRES